MKILLLEDELMLQNSIIEYLDTLGHKCTTFIDGINAKEALDTDIFDLLIFDINVPSLNGLELFEYLKKNNCNTPVIFISALTDINNISDAFTLGAADYIKKPFHLKELGIRVEKVSKSMKDKNRLHILVSKNYSYSKDDNCLYFNDIPQELTKKQLEIVHHLSINAGTIVSCELLREYVWNGSLVSDATIRTEISRLKKSLKEEFIQNHKGLGYKVDRYRKSL